MRFTITPLGTASAMPNRGRHHSAQVVNVHEQLYLVDCGEGTQLQLIKYGVNPLKINHVFLSHLHGDHVFGLFGLISTLGLLGKRTPLHLYAPRPIREIVESHRRFFDAQLPYEIAFHEIDTSQHTLLYETKSLEVWSLPLRHSIASAGFLFREKSPARNLREGVIERFGLSIAERVAVKNGSPLRLPDGSEIANESMTYLPYVPRSFAYCSDTTASGRVAQLIGGVDLLYHEATFGDDAAPMARKTGHSTARQAAGVACKAAAKRLIIGHFSSRYKSPNELLEQAREHFSNTDIALEGVVYEIKISKNSDTELCTF